MRGKRGKEQLLKINNNFHNKSWFKSKTGSKKMDCFQKVELVGKSYFQDKN